MNQKILLIDDDHELSQLVTEYLTLDGFQLDRAADGVTGLTMAQSGLYQLILLDVMLPGLDGLSLLRQLRQSSYCPVLMLTAMGTVDDRVEGLDSGADDYLTKPFAASELLARVRALGRRSEFAAGGPVSRVIVAGLELDESRRALTYAGQVVDLTAREYALLAHLMRNRGAALTRQQLLDEVWGAEPDVYSNVVDLYIHYLREKFKDAGHEDLIKTVRGVGYRLIEAEAS